MMQQRYWVIGGDYADASFNSLLPGTEHVRGPFDHEVEARTEWQRLTFRDRCCATTRFTIAVESGAAR